jgi:WD40 repeat protein
MRVFNAFNGIVHALAVSPDGRFLAAAAENAVAVWSWGDSRVVWWRRWHTPTDQLDFTPNGLWLAACGNEELTVMTTHDGTQTLSAGRSPGGIAFTPDGKHLVASESPPWQGGDGRLARWAVTSWYTVTGFDQWPPFNRLAFSPDGQYLAGVNPTRFELRIAVTGGLNGWGQPPPPKWGRPITPRHHLFLSFAHDSQTLVAGWDDEFHVLETVNGTPRRKVRASDAPFRDAAFTGSGRHLGTVDGTGTLKLWDAEGWQVVRAYDWQVGPLTRVAFTADGLAGVCGTGAGQLVVFDLDE